ncbi:MAG: hypothetical protein M1824_006524 [Vezdaea acicularis]|nr:MAG: hypothetical protein M1824_006524 [Vezdaea acicularis]
MSDFNQEKAYASQEDVYYDDGREIELLHFVYNHPSLADIRGSPTRVLQAIDEYGRKKKYLMNVGEDKGKIVTDLIAEVKPQIMVELGGYVGYSAVLFGNALRAAGGTRYYSLERSPEFAAVVSSLVNLAGLQGIVQVEVGPSSESLKRLHMDGRLLHIDLLFLDHHKPAYLTDLKLCEYLRLVRPGTVLAADNVIKPGNPPYLEYVRSSVTEKKKSYSIGGDGSTKYREKHASWVENPLVGHEREDGGDTEIRGNPFLVYESKLVKSFEPTGIPDGVEITRCVGEER